MQEKVCQFEFIVSDRNDSKVVDGWGVQINTILRGLHYSEYNKWAVK